MFERVFRIFSKPPLSLDKRGQRFAARYLRKQGMKLLAQNVLCPGGEIDILAVEGDELVFVEVRSRSSDVFMTPEGSIRHDKQQAMLRAARHVMTSRHIRTLKPRIDAVAIVWPDGAATPTLRHHRGALALSNW